MIKGDDTLTEISAFEAKGDEPKSIKTLWPAWRDKNYTNAYLPVQTNKELNLFLSCGYEHASSLAR